MSFNNNRHEGVLRQLIKRGLLGKGKGILNGKVGSQKIDLIYETNDDLWLIIAKNTLDYEVFGQLLTVKQLCSEEFVLTKQLKLGIVCEETDPNIEKACETQNIKIFLFTTSKKTDYEYEICDICGGFIIKDGKGNFICKTIRIHWL